LLGIERQVEPIHQYQHDIRVLLQALHTMFR